MITLGLFGKENIHLYIIAWDPNVLCIIATDIHLEFDGTAAV